MDTIFIPVGPEQEEDDIVELVETLRRLYGFEHVKFSEALQISSDVPEVMKLLHSLPVEPYAKQKAAAVKKEKPAPKGEKGVCPDCGAQTSKPGKRCRPCALRISRQIKADIAKAAEAL